MLNSIRLNTICSELDECDSFADIGCDHGYCTQYMLDRCLCRSAIISDVSHASLKKAETLLKRYIIEGTLTAVCCDGLSEIPEYTSQVLIAGMGGHEITEIMKRDYIPKKFILQPMKNSEEVRRFLVSEGCKITADYTFRDGKFYDLIKGEREGGEEKYTADEFEFGRDNIREKRSDFKSFIQVSIDKVHTYMFDKMSDANRATLLDRLEHLKRILNDVS